MSRVFISHSSLDKTFARLLAKDLATNNHEPWLDEWEIKVGECILTQIDRGIENSEFVIVVLSAHSVESGWVEKEWKTKYWEEINYDKTLVLPVLIEDCKVPPILKTKKYADFRQGYPIAFSDLLGAINTTNVPSNITSLSESCPENFDYYWHRGVQEYFGHTLHLTFVKYNAASIVFKDSVLCNIQDSRIQNYLIFELFSEWDILIRHWSTDQQANDLVLRLEDNIDVDRTDALSVTRMNHIYEDSEDYPSSEEIISIMDDIGFIPLRDVQANKKNSEYFDMACSKGLLLKDNIAFNSNKIQFYIVIRSIKRPSTQLKTILINQFKQFNGVSSKTLYITRGTSIRMVIKGQTDDYYNISDLLIEFTKIFQGDGMDVSTETVLVANTGIQVSNLFDFIHVEKQLTEKGFANLDASIIRDPSINISDTYELQSKYHRMLEVIHLDTDEVMINLLKAKLSNDPSHIKEMSNYFSDLEEQMETNLQRMVRQEYGNNWQEKLDEIKAKVGVNKQTKVDKLTLGDLCQIYRYVVIEKSLTEFSGINEKWFKESMEHLTVFRNKFAHKKASLKGWEEVFEFCLKFVPIRAKFIAYFQTLA